MALPLTNNAEGGSDGTFVTTGNSGGSSGDAFTAVLLSSGADPQPSFSNVQEAHGALAYRIVQPATPANTYCEYGSSVVGSIGTLGGRMYVWVSAYPASSVTLLRILAGTTRMCELQLRSAGGLRWLAGADGITSVGSTSTAGVPLSGWARIDWDVDFSSTNTGFVTASIFSGANLETTTPDTNGTSGANPTPTGTADLADTIRVGQVGGPLATGVTMYFDDLLLQSSGFGGPATTPPTAASAGTGGGVVAQAQQRISLATYTG